MSSTCGPGRSRRPGCTRWRSSRRRGAPSPDCAMHFARSLMLPESTLARVAEDRSQSTRRVGPAFRKPEYAPRISPGLTSPLPTKSGEPVVLHEEVDHRHRPLPAEELRVRENSTVGIHGMNASGGWGSSTRRIAASRPLAAACAPYDPGGSSRSRRRTNDSALHLPSRYTLRLVAIRYEIEDGVLVLSVALEGFAMLRDALDAAAADPRARPKMPVLLDVRNNRRVPTTTTSLGGW